MGLHRQFWIPQGFEVRQGVYVRYPHEELYAVLNLGSHRSRCEVVGENLGMVPEPVNESLLLHGIRGIYVLQYSLTGDASSPALPVPARCLASLNTYDTPPCAAFVSGVDVSERQAFGILPLEQGERELAARRNSIRAFYESNDRAKQLLCWLHFLKQGPAELVALSLEDLWFETEPQNVPGISSARPNWRRRLRHELDELPGEVLSLLQILRRD